jgi:hypothetical protein
MSPVRDEQRCIGYGDYEGKCGCPSDLDLNPSGLWCRRCELDRRAQITAAMARITQSFKGRQ